MEVYALILLLIMAGVIWHDFRLPKPEWSKGGKGNTGGTSDQGGSEKRWKAMLWITAGMMALVAGLRYHNGIDTWAYNVQYAYALSSEWESGGAGAISAERFEWLFRAVDSMGFGLWSVQLLCSGVLNGIFAWFTLRYTRRFFLAFLFYFVFAYFNLNFELMREGAAVGIALWAWDSYHRGEYWKYYLKILPGIFFHYSILVMAFLPLMHLPAMRRLADNWKGVAIFVAGGYALGFLMRLAVAGLAPEVVGLFPDGPFKDNTAYKLSVYLTQGVNPMSLNWKGYLGYLTGYVGYAIVIWYFLQLRIRGRNGLAKGNDEEGYSLDRDFGGMLLLMAAAVMASFQFETIGRLQNYLILASAVGFSRSVLTQNRTLWALVMVPMFIFKLYSYTAPVMYAGKGKVYELYVPYSDWIRKNTDVHQDSLFNLYHERARIILPQFLPKRSSDGSESPDTADSCE